MDEENTRVLLISANVGSIFEDPEQMFKPWLKEFTECISRLEPGFIAIHCQEVGGKNYEASMQHVNQFVKIILGCSEMEKYDRARVFLDEDYTAVDKFTALGNLYFIHDCIEEVSIWDFIDCKFVPVYGREVLSGNIENIPIKEKAKFPQHFFPEFKWSRKGFLRTRWSVNNCVFDLINIHLFHDASNIIAMESSPSLYSMNRQQALFHTLQRFENDNYESVPFFMFGDFNFRLDTQQLVKAITSKTESKETRGKKEQINKIVFTEQGNDKVVLTLETKGFDYHDKHSDLFFNSNQWLTQFDKELLAFHDKLEEFEINFPPSYPFSEDVNDGKTYMKTRCPSWCDRVLFNTSAKDIIVQNDNIKPCYDVLGREICMGDHKPVYLFVRLKPGKGNLNDSFDDPPFVFERKNTISINGEEMASSNLDTINIHDYAVFEREQHLPLSFRTSIKSHQSADNKPSTNSNQSPGSIVRKKSFHEAAKEVCQIEKVLLKWPLKGNRQRHHSSSSEDFESESEATTTSDQTSPKPCVLSDDAQSVATVESLCSVDNTETVKNSQNQNNISSTNSTDTNANLKPNVKMHEMADTKSKNIGLDSEESSDNKCKLIRYSASMSDNNPIEHVESSPTHDPRSVLVSGNKRPSVIKMAASESRCCCCVIL